MHAERDHLVRVVFPELRERLQPHRVYLDDIDLRWGITREQAENDKVLELCLQFVDECRPFFIGMLGQRYGYDTFNLTPQVVARYPWLAIRAGESLTELEIMHAVLRAPAMSGRSFFYFRDPGAADSVPESLRSEIFVETDRERAGKLERLKERIRQSGRPVFDGYPARWDDSSYEPVTRSQGLRGLELFGQTVRDQLWQAISAELGTAATVETERAPDPLLEERDYHERFMEARLRVYVGRSRINSELFAFADGQNEVPCLLLGPAGAGKSAALAQFALEYRKAHPVVPVVAHFVGASPRSANRVGMLRRICSELLSACLETQKTARRAKSDPKGLADIEKEYTIPHDAHGLAAKFSQFIAKIDNPVVIVIDALDQLEEVEGSQLLEWLPPKIPPHVTIIVSCVAREQRGADVINAFRSRPHHQLAIGPLSMEERKEIVREVPSLTAKSLDHQQVELLLANVATMNPLFLRVALEELRGFGSYEKLSDRIRSLPGSAATVRGPVSRRLGHVLAALTRSQRQEQDAEETSDDVISVFAQVIDRLEQEFDPAVVRSMPSSICAARRGLYEREIRDLCSEASSADDVFVILRQLRPYLLSRAGLLDFYHESLRIAVRNRYLATDRDDAATHSRLADYFWNQPAFHPAAQIDEPNRPERPRQQRSSNERRADELLWQLIRANRYDDAITTLITLEFLESKAEAGLVRDLSSDFAMVREKLATIMPGNAGFEALKETATTILPVLEEAVDRDLEFIARHPTTLFQCLWNSSWWYDSPEAAKHYVKFAERPSQIHNLLERWREGKEARQPGFYWVRSLRPPARSIGSGSRVLAGHTARIHAASLSADGLRLASGSRDGTVRLWDTTTGEELRAYRHDAPAVAVAIAPHRRWIVSAAGMSRTLSIWDTTSGEKIKDIGQHEKPIRCVAMTPDGRYIASGAEDSTVRVWDFEAGAELAVLRGHQANVDCVAFSPDSSFLISGGGSTGRDYSVRIWQWRAGKQLFMLSGHRSIVHGVAYSPDGKLVASCSGDTGGDYSVLVWNPGTSFVRKFEGHSDSVEAVCFSPDNRLILSGSWDETLRLWDVESVRSLASIKVGAKVNAVGFFPDGHHVFSGAEDGKLRIWKDLERLAETPTRFEFRSNTWTISYAPDGAYVATGSENGEIHIWAEDGRLLRALERQPGPVDTLAFSPDNTRVATCTGVIRWAEDEPWRNGEQDLAVRVYEAATGKLVGRISGIKAKIRALNYVNQDRTRALIVAGGKDGMIGVWEDGTLSQLANLSGHHGAVVKLVTHNGGHWLISAGADGTTRRWDLRTLREVVCYRKHEAEVLSVAVSPDATRIASAAKDGTLCVYDLETGADLLVLNLSVPREPHSGYAWVDFSNDGNRIVREGFQDIREYSVPGGELLRHVRKLGSEIMQQQNESARWRLDVDAQQPDQTTVSEVWSEDPVAWFPAPLYGITPHPNGRIWAGSPSQVKPLQNEARFVEFICLEGG